MYFGRDAQSQAAPPSPHGGRFGGMKDKVPVALVPCGALLWAVVFVCVCVWGGGGGWGGRAIVFVTGVVVLAHAQLSSLASNVIDKIQDRYN